MKDYYFYIQVIGSAMLGPWNIRLCRGLTGQLVPHTSETHRGDNRDPAISKNCPRSNRPIPESRLGPTSPFYSVFTQFIASIGKQAFKNNH